MKRSFFQAAVTSILLYGCTTWTLTKRLEKKLDGNYTRMLRAILNKSWQRHPTRHQLYGHLPPITKSIQVRRTRHAGHCWRSRDELIRDVLLWIPTHGRAKAGRPARTYIQQLCEDTGCCPEDLPRAMNDREEWRERVRDIRAASTIWWWWWYIYIYIYIYIIPVGMDFTITPSFFYKDDFGIKLSMKLDMSLAEETETPPHTYKNIYIYIYIYIYVYTRVSNVFFFSTGIWTMHKNEAGPQWITSLLLNIVTVSLDNNESMGDPTWQSIKSYFCMKILNHTQISRQERQSPHWGGQLYCSLHTHQI